MLYITSPNEGLELFKVLGSDIRIEIIKLLLKNKRMSMNEIATKLKITNGALTSHIRKLESVGLISISSETGGHGNLKLCSLRMDKILVDFTAPDVMQNVYNTDVKIGHYSNYKVYPTCGISTNKSLIGEVDDTRYFAHPDRFNAEILWFTKGFIEYELPNFIPFGTRITQLTISEEISSEAPGVNNVWPSDITFSVNDTEIGMWTSPGDFGDVPGIFTPDWWFPNWNQYGLLKLIVINQNGTHIDGLKVSDVTIQSLNLDYQSKIRFRMEVKKDAVHVGGLTIFGSSFGNYAQDIKVSIQYE
ncbi:MAG: winged helix-turn-helix transcriptional regulator [Lachnospiraceae bacterium]|nr:winged helix-turn-helix transcriptional regulator [Lachnospiraceae bacterium]